MSSALISSETKGWNFQEELLAKLCELTDAGNLYVLATAGVKQYQLPDPIKIPRPYQLMRKKRRATVNETLAIFGQGVQYVPKQEEVK
jgi:hypothetical protein